MAVDDVLAALDGELRVVLELVEQDLVDLDPVLESQHERVAIGVQRARQDALLLRFSCLHELAAEDELVALHTPQGHYSPPREHAVPLPRGQGNAARFFAGAAAFDSEEAEFAVAWLEADVLAAPDIDGVLEGAQDDLLVGVRQLHPADLLALIQLQADSTLGDKGNFIAVLDEDLDRLVAQPYEKSSWNFEDFFDGCLDRHCLNEFHIFVDVEGVASGDEHPPAEEYLMLDCGLIVRFLEQLLLDFPAPRPVPQRFHVVAGAVEAAH